MVVNNHESDVHPFICRICGADDVIPDEVLPTTMAGSAADGEGPTDVSFALCRKCGTVQAVKYVKFDYADPAAAYYSNDYELKMYLELEAGFYFFAAQLFTITQYVDVKQKVRFLDLGGGFGIISHMAKILWGWDVVNSDPTQRCEIGGVALGINVFTGYVDSSTFLKDKFNIVLCSEVIEHVYDPDIFLQTISASLNNDGLMLLTTPNAAAISTLKDSWSDWAEIYSPGQHYNIFSKQSLSLILKRNGFNSLLTKTTGGAHDNKRIIVLAGRSGIKLMKPLILPTSEQSNLLFVNYAEKALLEPTRNSWHETYKMALRTRLFETFVNNGAYKQALKISQKYASYLHRMDIAAYQDGFYIEAENWRDFVQKYPPFLGKYFYYRGMIALNYERDFKLAHTYFYSAFTVLNKMRSLTFLHLEDMIGFAALHAGISLKLSGKNSEAIALLEETLDLYFIPLHVVERLKNELNHLLSIESSKLSDDVCQANLLGEDMPAPGEDVFKYFEIIVNDSNTYEQADTVSRALDFFLEYQNILPFSAGQSEKMCSYFDKYLYFRGILNLNHRGDYRAAVEDFSNAASIMQEKRTAGKSVEIDFIGLALLHQSISLRYLGELDTAGFILDQALALDYIPDEIRDRLQQESK